MRTIRFLEDNEGKHWIEGNMVYLTLNGVHAGAHKAKITRIGVQMIRVDLYTEHGTTEVQLLDINTITSIQAYMPEGVPHNG